MTSSPPTAMLSVALNRRPESLSRIHLIGICGTGMASLAGILKQRGYQVTGSDQHVYPPMSLFLEALEIPVLEGYQASHLHPEPDLVVVGNVVTRENPEAVELSRLGLPYLSFPQALRHFAMEGKKSIVVGGTHGKTTTASLAAWILESGGLAPSFMIGGIPRNFRSNFKLSSGPYFVIEGDEYDTAFFDKGPKFLHYNPWVLILTGIEFDHADIYRDLEHVIGSFRRLIELLPPDGLLIANGDDPIVTSESTRAKCPVIPYSLGGNGSWRIEERGSQGGMTGIRLSRRGEEVFSAGTPLYGRHNLSNLLSTVVLADFLGIPKERISESLAGFRGVKRRQEVVGEKGGVTVLDDFAHHPTAVRETISAVRGRYPGRRIIAVFEPRSNSSRRNVFQAQYARSFDSADLVMVPEPPLLEKIPPGERFSSEDLIRELQSRGVESLYFPGTEPLLSRLAEEVRPEDVVLFMSNGSFDNLHRRLLERL
jgi:UDP-N-acetylmuramate: L-alanyl-gamma-D-glutamyl-meso-diaminopimelate ligase